MNSTTHTLSEIEQEFIEYLNENYPWYEVDGGLTEISPYRILSSLDRKTYDLLFEQYREKHYNENTDRDTGERTYYTTNYGDY